MTPRRAALRELVEIGVLVNTHGVRGEIRMLPHNPDTQSIRPGQEVTLLRGSERRTAEVTGVRRHKRFLLLTLDGVTTMDQAVELVGSVLCVAAADLPPAGADEAYHFQLEGWTVVTTAGEEIGRIESVFTTPANDVCVVRRGGREMLIPLVADVVKRLDKEGGRLVIEPLPGLLDDLGE